MADETSSETPATPESGSGTSIEKFATPEERDKAYLELEKLTYAQTQRLADVEKRLEDMVNQQVPQDTRQFIDQYPSSNAQSNIESREADLASRLLTKPSEVLKQHAEFVRAEARKEFQQELVHQRIVDRFQHQYPDLIEHEDLVSVYVRKQPANLPPQERLKRAGLEVRKYISSLAKGNNQTSLDPAAYVESPSQSGASTPTTVDKEPSQEDELTAMIRERQAIHDKKRL